MPTYRIPLDPTVCLAVISSSRWNIVVDGATDCHVWQGHPDRAGYGQLRVLGRRSMAHRVAFVAASGSDIPSGVEIDHLCRNKLCVNPEHMELVTHSTNLRRAYPDDCSRGHGPKEVVDEPRRYRVCRECLRIYQYERWRNRST